MSINIKALREQLSYERQALKEMKSGGASIPAGWSIEKQDGFIKGMANAMAILSEA